MARFLVKASEFKNVCKAVNDRRLAELKKEIIEILKKQDEKEVKKAIDYFNSQELHYTHLEKSLNGKWIEKAGYGIGTVRIWKGKKYKKIAPGKWARVFEKEGRGTNIAIGKLIAEVEKKQSVEELMDFVMAHKQRFVDDNGMDLPILDKLRAAADVKNEKLSGESSPYVYGVGENVNRAKNEMFSKKDKITKEEADLHKISRKYSQIPTSELKQRKAKLDRWIENKTRNKREHLNNAIFRDSYKNEVEAINKELDKRNKENEYKLGDQLKLKNGKTVEYAGKGKDGKIRYTDRNGSTPITGTMDESEVESVDNSKLSPKEQTENFVIDTLYNKKDSKPAEKKEDDSKAYEGKLATQKQVDEATAISNKYEVSRNEMLKKPITTIQKYANSKVEDFEGGIDKFIEYMAEGRSEGVSMDEVGKEFAKLINHNVARKIWHDYESGALVPDEKGILKPKEESENKTYWIQDFEGNRITSDDAKNKIKGIKDKLEYMESMKEGRSKDVVVSIDTSIRQLENYRDDLISKLNPEDRKEIESEAEKHQNRSDAMKGNKNAEKEPETKNPYDSMNEKEIDIEVSKELDNLAAKSKMPTIHEAANYIKENNKELYNNLEKRWGDSLISALADVAIDRKNKKDNEAEKTLNIDTSVKALSFDELQPIATNKSVGENEVQMPYSKDIAAEVEALKKCVYELPDRSREFMRHVYYVDGNLVATDGRRMKVVKVGELDGISDGSYVDITTNKSGINIKKKEVEGNFPNYKKVIPDNLNQTATLDTKLVKEKIKEMRKDGAIDKKGVNLVQLEFRDGKVFIDDTPVGNAKDIALKFSKNWGETTDDTNFVDFNADYLENALTGKTAVLQMGDRADKAMAINTGSTSNIVMPMSGNGEKRDYSGNRMARDAENEAKDKKKADNRKYNESKIKEYTPKNVNINIDDMKNRMKEMSDEELKRNYDMLTFNLDKVMDKKMFTTGSAKVDSKLGLDLAHAVAYKAIVEKYPEVKDIVSSELESRGISVKKSLFDDFIVDVFAADDEEEIEDELYEGETEYNDYSAEQPELFNSTSMKVREALDRINNQVL